VGARGSGMPVNARAEEILARVRAIPEGFVQTYGDIDPRAPRIVGQVLATATNDVPWHRVVRADGSLAKGTVQAERLRKEGTPMRGDRVDLRQARWLGTAGHDDG
jgi:methylated-DNA-protein-cysteine methyltransferase related protein